MSKDIKEKPILFNGEMVRAVLNGRKTQTRRVVKPQPGGGVDGCFHRPDGRWIWLICGGHLRDSNESGGPGVGVGLPFRCPYGQPGDRLWVRETWKPHSPSLGTAFYRADSADAHGGAGRWRPSIHLPRWASRINLEVKAVHVERVQDITEEDAIAEGVFYWQGYWCSTLHPIKGTYQCWPSARVAFEKLWDSINAKRGYSWAENPWCWCVSFEVIPNAT